MTKKIECPFCNGTGEVSRGEKQRYRIRLKKGSLRIKLKAAVHEEVEKLNSAGDVIARIKELKEKAIAPYFDHAMIEDPPGTGFRKPRLYVLTDDEYLKIITEFETRGIEYEGYLEAKLPSPKLPLPETKKPGKPGRPPKATKPKEE